MSFFGKYIKYKSKYLETKKQINNNDILECEKKFQVPNKLFFNKNNDNTVEVYYDNLFIAIIDNVIYELLLNHDKIFLFFKQEISKSLDLIDTKKKQSDDWYVCSKKCFSSLSKIINSEINSTSYIIKILLESIIKINNNNDIYNDKYNESYISILWTSDNNPSNIWKNDNLFMKTLLYSNKPKTKLLMGFGPSASGKTFWAKKIIEKISLFDKTYPNLFLTIDGGVYRNSSIIYNIIKTYAICTLNINGIKNLVTSSFFGPKTLFDSNVIKKNVSEYLLSQGKFNLYVPETLSKCFIFPCNIQKSYKIYFDITFDIKSWSCVFIWQHKNSQECTEFDNKKCIGCNKSGKSREIIDGKQYNDISWKYAYAAGLKYIKSAPGYKFYIHNCGGNNCITKIEELDNKCSKIDCQIFKSNNINYVCKCNTLDKIKN